MTRKPLTALECTSSPERVHLELVEALGVSLVVWKLGLSLTPSILEAVHECAEPESPSL